MGPGRHMGGQPPMMGGQPPHRPRHDDFPGRPPKGKMMFQADDFIEEHFDMEQMEQECEEMLRFSYLTKENAHFTDEGSGILNMTYDNKTYENVSIIKTFPFTDPDLCLSVRNSDLKKKEIGMIADLNKDFDADTISLINEHLKQRYYMPVIEKFVQIKENGGYITFTVLTDHGETNFTLQSNGSHFSYLTDTRIIITDLEGNRYEIPDTGKLTTKELKKLDLYM